MTASPAATAPSRTGESRPSAAGSPASAAIQVMSSDPLGERADHAVGVAGADRPREPRDAAPEAVDGAQHDDAVADRRLRGRIGRRDRRPGRLRKRGAGGRAHAGAAAAGPTMSPSTAPASIDVSCPGSPTRISRASGRTASASRAISDSATIEVSSTITTS